MTYSYVSQWNRSLPAHRRRRRSPSRSSHQKGDQAGRKTRRIKPPSRRLYCKEIYGSWTRSPWISSKKGMSVSSERLINLMQKKVLKFSTYRDMVDRDRASLVLSLTNHERFVSLCTWLKLSIDSTIPTEWWLWELNREPLIEELATELEMDVRKVRQMRINQDILSIDTPVGKKIPPRWFHPGW